MITIKLSSTVFDPGGLFEGVPRSKAMLHIGTGKQEQYAYAKDAYPTGNLRHKDYANSLIIDVNGLTMTDTMFETVMDEGGYTFSSFGVQVLEYQQQGLIQVYQGSTLLGTADIKNYTAVIP
jgi:hypothetical protein